MTLNDLRYALRSLRRTPVFSVVAVLSLALGIGANTAIFSLLDQALLRSLAVREPDRLVAFHAGDLKLQGTSSSDNHETVFSLPMYRELSKRPELFEGVIARAGMPPVVLQGRCANCCVKSPRRASKGGAYAKLSRANGYADGYMAALLDAGLVERDGLLKLVGEERLKLVTPSAAAH